MQKLNLPSAELELRKEGQSTLIKDVVRGKFVVLQPEEWVRQHLIHFLHHSLGYPFGLMAVEKQLLYNGKKWRTDIVLYNSSGAPRVLVECKAPDIELSEQTFAQAARYNLVHRVPFLFISNGLKHYCCKVNIEEGSYQFLQGVPAFKEINE